MAARQSRNPRSPRTDRIRPARTLFARQSFAPARAAFCGIMPAHSKSLRMNTSLLKTAVILGLVTAVGPIAIDMYLPALPAIAEGLGTGTAAVQTSLTAFFISFGLFQAIYGPVSDVIGRKAPFYFGLGLFTLGSIGCALAPNIEALIFFRFIQGIGASVGMVLPLS